MKHLLLFTAILTLTGCGETGRLLGTVTMIPARVLTGNMYTDTGVQSDLILPEEAVPLHMSE